MKPTKPKSFDERVEGAEGSDKVKNAGKLERGQKRQGGLRGLFFKELDEKTLDMLQAGKKKKKPALTLSVTVSNRTRQAEIKDFPCVIGRVDSEADLVCDDLSVSSRHAVIDIRDNKVIITDTNSSNGIEVRGLKLARNSSRQLFQGDVLLLGNAKIGVVKIANLD